MLVIKHKVNKSVISYMISFPFDSICLSFDILFLKRNLHERHFPIKEPILFNHAVSLENWIDV